jgi:hypothetical protein
MIKSLLLFVALSFGSGCALSSSTLPDEYVRCQHVESEEVFKYEEEDAVVHRPVVCPSNVKDANGSCPTIYVITDLNDTVRYYTGLEIVNWRCENVTLRRSIVE